MARLGKANYLSRQNKLIQRQNRDVVGWINRNRLDEKLNTVFGTWTLHTIRNDIVKLANRRDKMLSEVKHFAQNIGSG